MEQIKIIGHVPLTLPDVCCINVSLELNWFLNGKLDM